MGAELGRIEFKRDGLECGGMQLVFPYRAAHALPGERSETVQSSTRCFNKARERSDLSRSCGKCGCWAAQSSWAERKCKIWS